MTGQGTRVHVEANARLVDWAMTYADRVGKEAMAILEGAQTALGNAADSGAGKDTVTALALATVAARAARKAAQGMEDTVARIRRVAGRAAGGEVGYDALYLALDDLAGRTRAWEAAAIAASNEHGLPLPTLMPNMP